MATLAFSLVFNGLCISDQNLLFIVDLVLSVNGLAVKFPYPVLFAFSVDDVLEFPSNEEVICRGNNARFVSNALTIVVEFSISKINILDSMTDEVLG